MIFKRRDKPPVQDRIREAIVPRKGWARALEYIAHRVRRLPDTPHRIALGCACGAMVSFTPFFGLHFGLAAALAWVIRGNILAALIGTMVGNPFTFPLIAWISMALGRRILGTGLTGRDFARVMDAFVMAGEGLWQTFLSLFGIGTGQWAKVATIWNEVGLPYLVGGLLPGLVTSIALYYVVRGIVATYQAARLARRRRHARRVEQALKPTTKSAADEPD